MESNYEIVFMVIFVYIISMMIGYFSQVRNAYVSYDVFIVITKAEPEKYVSEALSGILSYAAQEKIPVSRVEEILKAQNHDSI